jgi:hypothetical protein
MPIVSNAWNAASVCRTVSMSSSPERAATEKPRSERFAARWVTPSRVAQNTSAPGASW